MAERTLSQPPASLGPLSRFPPAAENALGVASATATRLRREADAATSDERRARILTEIGEIEERAADEAAAARDYLAAFNAESDYREPLEGLLRLLERRRSTRNLGKIVDAMASAASTPSEITRAQTLRAAYLEDVAQDLETAKSTLLDAVTTESPAIEKAAAWLALEIVAAKTGDVEMRSRALGERVRSSGDPTWRALLQLDWARVLATSGAPERALGVLEDARKEDTPIKFMIALAQERLARTEDAGATRAAALEAQAEMIRESLTAPARGDELGVPRWMRSPTQMVDAWLRAAETRATLGENDRAAAVLDRALEAITITGEEAGAPLEPSLMHARIQIAERLGDTKRAAELADRLLATEKDGRLAASLAMKIAEHAATEGDATRALGALSRAVASSPECLPARALQLDLLADGGAPKEFATQLAAFAEHLTSDEARARAFLLAAYVHGASARDGEAARAALRQAGLSGVPRATLALFERMLASIVGDRTWYEEATRRLATAYAEEESPVANVAVLAFELARARILRSDHEGAAEALRALGAAPKGQWIGRVLEAFLPLDVAKENDRRVAALYELVPLVADPHAARSIALVAAARAYEAGDRDSARATLLDIARADAGDPIATAFAADLARLAGNAEAAAAVASACAAATDDATLATALHLEAGFEMWRAGERDAAIDAFAEATLGAGEAARPVLAWASYGVDADTIEGRRQTLDRAVNAGADASTTALDRFAAEVSLGDPEEAATALVKLESESSGDLAIAAALARLVWPLGGADPEAQARALDRIAAAGADAKTFAAAERLRIARDGDPEEATNAARAWFTTGGGLTAGIEWLASSVAFGSAEAEIDARESVASTLRDDSTEAMLASAKMLRALTGHDEPLPMLAGDTDATRLGNLELAPPGSDPRRRSAALASVQGSLGEAANVDALALAGWSLLVAGEASAALAAFVAVTTARPENLAAWEGVRSAATVAADTWRVGVALEQLGARCANDARGAAFWEEAATTWATLGEGDRAEDALEASFGRDVTRASAFDKLFRRVREKKDGDRLLALIARRLAFADDPPEIAKLFWEQARVLREKGDIEGALKSLDNVTMLEADHVGALALRGEIHLRRGEFQEAAACLARLSEIEEAPAKNRVTAGVAAVDIYENKLQRVDRALEVLVGLHTAKLSTLPVRERLARAAARAEAWDHATSILEELMNERQDSAGRIEAARLAMAIHRDRIKKPAGAAKAIAKLLQESPMDEEALDLLFTVALDAATKTKLLESARTTLITALQKDPTDLDKVKRLATAAELLKDDALAHIATTVAIALGERSAESVQLVMQYASKKPRAPQIAITEPVLQQILAPGDGGPLAQLFALLAPTLAEALGPSLAAAGVTKKDKVDARSGIALRNEIATWAGAFGIREFDLYVGGKDPKAIVGVPGETPAIVVGAEVNAPLGPTMRARLARELLALTRGTTITRWRDETTIAAIVVVACKLGDVKTETPAYPMLAEVEKLISKAIARKVKKQLPEICKKIVATKADAKVWSHRALASHERVAIVACGDVGATMLELLGLGEDAKASLPALIKKDPRAIELLKFALSPTYLELRRALGLEGAS